MAGEHSSSPGPRPRVYQPEFRERAVRMVQESFDRGDQRFGAVARIARQLGIGPESLCQAKDALRDANADGRGISVRLTGQTLAKVNG